MNWQAWANPISLGILFFVAHNAILTTMFLRQIKTCTKMSRFMTRKMLLIHAAAVSACLARISLSRYPQAFLGKLPFNWKILSMLRFQAHQFIFVFLPLQLHQYDIVLFLSIRFLNLQADWLCYEITQLGQTLGFFIKKQIDYRL